MATHNGYRPFNPGSALAQLHPSSAKVAIDEDGLLPEWIVYHEHIVTSRPFLKKVLLFECKWASKITSFVLSSTHVFSCAHYVGLPCGS